MPVDLSTILRIGIRAAERAPAAVRAVTNAERYLKDKDPEALMYFVGDGKFDLVEIAAGEYYRRNAENAVPALMNGVQTFLDYMSGNVIEGEVVRTDPWIDFIRHFKGITYGVIVIFGSRQYGKTTLAYKLADVLRKSSGYKVEIVGTYRQVAGSKKKEVPLPDWMTPIPMERLIARMSKSGRWLFQVESANIDDGLTEDEVRGKPSKGVDLSKKIPDAEILKLQDRIIIVDEASALFGALSSSGQTKSREAAKMLDNQSGHVRNILICICQKISEMPDSLQADAIKFYKWANPDVVADDRKDGKVKHIREQWTEALEALNEARNNPKWGLYPDIRSWAYVKAGNVGSAGHGAQCIMPFDPLTPEQAHPEKAKPIDGEVIDADLNKAFTDLMNDLNIGITDADHPMPTEERLWPTKWLRAGMAAGAFLRGVAISLTTDMEDQDDEETADV